MKFADAKSYAIKLAKLFPGQVTDGQVPEMVKHFQNCERAAVDAAISEHHKSVKRLDWPTLAAACDQTPAAVPAPTRATNDEGSWFDVRRRQRPQLASACDVEVALRVFRDFWRRSRQSDSDRRWIVRDCVTQIMSAAPLTEGGDRLDQASAEQWAATIFEDPDQFRRVLDDLRGYAPLPFEPAFS